MARNRRRRTLGKGRRGGGGGGGGGGDVASIAYDDDSPVVLSDSDYFLVSTSSSDSDSVNYTATRKRGRPRKVPSDDEEDEDYRLSEEGACPAEAVAEEEAAEAPVPVVVGNQRAGARRHGRKGRRKRDKDEPPLIWEVLEEENERWIDRHISEGAATGGPDETQRMVETLDASPDVILPLLRFQKEWLAWALKQEESPMKGGILADEMGMGKTIQAISLVLTARSFRLGIDEPASNGGLLASSLQPLPAVKCTLVICPVIAVSQWANEIRRYTEAGSARVMIYHGPKRSKTQYDFNAYDFVLTTYSIVESEYRNIMMGPKDACIYCGKKLRPDKMKVHHKYYCGPDAVKTDKQAKQVRKARKHMKLTKQVESSGKKDWDGKCRVKKKDEGNDQNEKINSTDNASLSKSLLHSVKWERIILDEAHCIKNRTSNTSRAVFLLESLYRWALSGTPLQNRVGELYSLVRFLQVQPYAFHFCQDCDCKKLDFHSKCDCIHSNARHFSWWNKYITRPVQNGKTADDGKRALAFLRGKLLKTIVLRRTKIGRAEDIALPSRIISLRRDSLDKNEHDFYEALYTQSQTQFDSYLDAGTLMNNYAHIFDLLTRLRQAVDHPYLVVYTNTMEESNDRNDNTATGLCGICHDSAEDPVVTSCGHVFCKSCFIDYSEALGNVDCPSCSKPVSIDLTTKPMGQSSSTFLKGVKRSSILRKLNLQQFKTSTKIDALREEIRNMVEQDAAAKGIVFSQFTSFLDLISYSLQKSGIKFVQLVGSMTIAERDKAIKAFTEEPDCKVFLMSLKAGGVALNLTVASHVFLMDPWWNPAVEHQAQDRIHRIGQYKPIRVVRFVIKETIEERILSLQEKKQLVFEGTLGDSSKAMAKLTEADLRFLFQN